jgi:hypothetical protein
MAAERRNRRRTSASTISPSEIAAPSGKTKTEASFVRKRLTALL